MKPKLFVPLLIMLAGFASTATSHGQTLPGVPQDNGVTPKTTTFYINTPDTINNNKTESLGVAIASNGNVIVGWEDDGSDLTDLEAVWTMFDSNGTSITPNTQITTIDPAFAGQTLTSKFLSYFRSNGTAISGRTSWGPKIHANAYGDGVGMGGTSFELGLEVPELQDINVDAGGGGDFPTVQLLSNSGQPIRIVTIADADAEPAGDIRIGDWEILSNGNIVIAGESRQESEMVDKFGGDTPLRHAAYRVVNSSGAEVKAWSLVSSTFDRIEGMWHGAASTKNGFALRFPVASRTQIRLFDNAGNPVSENIDVGAVAGDDAAAGGGRGDGTGFHGNGNDAYVLVTGAGTQVRLTVLKADGTLRYSRSAIDDVTIKAIGRTDAAISEAGDVLVVLSATYEGGPVNPDTGADVPVVLGRLFDPKGTPKGGTFYVSEKEAPTANPLRARNPRVAWRGDTAAVVWESLNSGQLVSDAPVNVVAARLFSLSPSQIIPGTPENNGVAPKTTTFYINTPDTINNNSTESLGVAIAANGNVIIGWEDDGSDLTDLEAVWTMFDSNGTSITPNTQITTIDPAFAGQTLTSKFLSYFRSNGTAISGRTSWGPKIHANAYGDGVGMGGTSFELGLEVLELAEINNDAGGGGDFPAVQLLSNTGQPIRIVTIADADAEPAGDIRIGDWEYLANGNIVIAGESRQEAEMVDRFGGDVPLRHAAYRVVNSSGAEVKAWSLVSSTKERVEMWHGAASTMNGFALRFPVAGRTQIRLFDNNGAPVSENIDVGTVAGDDAAAGGGRGDGTGFHGNGKDAYVLVTGAGTQVRLTVLKADGTLRYSRSAMDDLPVKSIGRTDAAIAPTGEVLVVASVTYDGGPINPDTGADVSAVVGRLFDASGTPKGGTFYVSEKEVPSNNPLRARNPRVAWRGNTAAIVWESLNSGQLVNGAPVNVVAARFFTPAVTLPPSELRITSVTRQANNLSLAWTGGRAPYTVQRKAQLTDAEWIDVATTSETAATVAIDSPHAFIRVVSRVTFAVALSGAAERPNPVTSAGTGSGTLILDGRKLTVDIAYSGLTGNVSAAHIHGPAGPEQATGVLQGLLPALGATGATSGTIKGELTISSATAKHMINGMTYVNIHTSFAAGGEIRGQAVPQP